MLGRQAGKEKGFPLGISAMAAGQMGNANGTARRPAGESVLGLGAVVSHQTRC